MLYFFLRHSAPFDKIAYPHVLSLKGRDCLAVFRPRERSTQWQKFTDMCGFLPANKKRTGSWPMCRWTARIFVRAGPPAARLTVRLAARCRLALSGDLLVVLSIDRPGRNYKEILRQWQLLTGEKRVDAQALDMSLLNPPSKDAMGVFVADPALYVFSYVAEAERENLKRRQSPGHSLRVARPARAGAV